MPATYQLLSKIRFSTVTLPLISDIESHFVVVVLVVLLVVVAVRVVVIVVVVVMPNCNCNHSC